MWYKNIVYVDINYKEISEIFISKNVGFFFFCVKLKKKNWLKCVMYCIYVIYFFLFVGIKCKSDCLLEV